MSALSAAFGGARPVVRLVAAMPSVIKHDASSLAAHYSSLAPTFGDEQLQAMLAKCPQLLISSPFTVWTNLSALCEILSPDDSSEDVASPGERGRDKG